MNISKNKYFLKTKKKKKNMYTHGKFTQFSNKTYVTLSTFARNNIMYKLLYFTTNSSDRHISQKLFYSTRWM